MMATHVITKEKQIKVSGKIKYKKKNLHLHVSGVQLCKNLWTPQRWMEKSISRKERVVDMEHYGIV